MVDDSRPKASGDDSSQVHQISYADSNLAVKGRESVFKKRKIIAVNGFLLIFACFLLLAVFGPPPLDGLFGVYKATASEKMFGQLGGLLSIVTPFIISIWTCVHMFKVEKAKVWVSIVVPIVVFIATVITMGLLFFAGWVFIDDVINPMLS